MHNFPRCFFVFVPLVAPSRPPRWGGEPLRRGGLGGGSPQSSCACARFQVPTSGDYCKFLNAAFGPLAELPVWIGFCPIHTTWAPVPSWWGRQPPNRGGLGGGAPQEGAGVLRGGRPPTVKAKTGQKPAPKVRSGDQKLQRAI